MILSYINAEITRRTGASVLDYTYLARTTSINNWLMRYYNWVSLSQDESDIDDKNNTTFSEKKTALEVGRKDYSLPDELSKLKRVEISYDGQSWARAIPIDAGQIDVALDGSEAVNIGSTSAPRYDTYNNALILYPTPSAAVANGLHIWYERLFNSLAYTSEASNALLTGTASIGTDANAHELFILGPVYDWRSSKLGDKSLMQDIVTLQAEIMRQVNTKQKDRNYAFGAAFVDYE